mgnify:CR=1 FL=1
MKIFSLVGGVSVKALVLIGAIVSLSLPVGEALAKDHIGKSHGHEHEFYALSKLAKLLTIPPPTTPAAT